MTRSTILLGLLAVGTLYACASAKTLSNSNADAGAGSETLAIVATLSSDDMAGRQTGTEGNVKARAFLKAELATRDLSVTEQAFTFVNRKGKTLEGVNLLTRIEGKGAGPVMVVTAHYDHVGVRGGQVYNGADDNASGVAGAFAMADHFRAAPPEHDVVIALLDAEEMGLHGARALVADGLPGGGKIALNLNLDMLSKNDKNELYAAGAWHRAWLEPILTAVAEKAPVTLKLGHDDPALGQGDWTLQSDHGPFHLAGIPFVYFGVENHKEYHQPNDDFETIPQDFFLRSVETVVIAAEMLDTELESIASREP